MEKLEKTRKRKYFAKESGDKKSFLFRSRLFRIILKISNNPYK